jgi:hypothetical protein
MDHPATYDAEDRKRDNPAFDGLHRDGMLGDHSRTALRLYDLLDTLVAMRLDVGASPKGLVAETTLGAEKIAAVRLLLDRAIESTKDFIGDITRPSPPLR